MSAARRLSAAGRKARVGVLRAVRDAMRGDFGNGADYREALHKAIARAQITRERAAEILGVSQHTIDSWLKPETSKSHNRCPHWAVELLKLETE